MYISINMHIHIKSITYIRFSCDMLKRYSGILMKPLFPYHFWKGCKIGKTNLQIMTSKMSWQAPVCQSKQRICSQSLALGAQKVILIVVSFVWIMGEKDIFMKDNSLTRSCGPLFTAVSQYATHVSSKFLIY